MKTGKTSSVKLSIIVSAVVLSAVYSFAQNLPTAKSIAAEMGMAWNIGNTMEAPGGPTGWGNPVPNQQLFDSVKAAGFNTVRIPCAWDLSHVNQTTLEIDPAWMTQVKQVVDYCIKDSLFVVLNIHWDGGWLQARVDSAVSSSAIRQNINKKQGAYWRQIATAFRNYDRHLLFASTNEPGVKDAAAMDVLNSFHQIFIDTVRATGGNNASRTLVIQGPNTALEDTYKLMTKLPTDKIADRIMTEVHYYPYPFCLMSKDADWGKASYYWGKMYKSTTDTDRNSYFGEESYTDSVFNLMKTQFTSKNIPVLLGEFGAMKRLTLTGDSLKRHILSRRYFYEYVSSSCKQYGLIPVAWDAGFKGDGTMTMFDRKTGGFYDIGIVNAMRKGWGMAKLSGDTSLVETVAPGNKSIKLLYSSKDSLQGNVQLPVVKSNMSNYDSITVRAFVNGETKYDSAGVTKYGFMNLNLVTMSKNWTWRQASFGTVVMDDWATYTIPISNDTTNKAALVPADPTQIDYFAVQAFSKGYRGTIYIDWIVFKSKNGTSDTVYSFDQSAPEQFGGNVESVKLIPTGNVVSDVEWKTATKKYPYALSAGHYTSAINPGALRTASVNGKVFVSFTSAGKGPAEIALRDLQGKTILSQKILAKTGLNHLNFQSNYHGVMILQINQGNQRFSGRVVCR